MHSKDKITNLAWANTHHKKKIHEEKVNFYSENF